MSQSIEEHTGARIARIRKQRGLTQQGLAMRAHVSKSLLSKVECGQKPASPALVAACARALGVSTSELLGQPYADELRRDRMDALIQPIREGLENWDIPLDWETAPRPAVLIWADVQRALEQRRQAQYTDMVRDLPVLIDESVQAVHTSAREEQRLAYECLAESMTPRARSWGRRGCTPVVQVRGRGSGRVSMAGLTCYKPGKRSRMFYSVREYRGPKGAPKGIGWRDLSDLLVRAHIQLGGPIVLVWDNLRMHLVEPLREFIAAHTDWLTVFQLPSYTPDLNPQEGIWSLVKRDIANLAAADPGQITRAVKRRLKQIQYRPDLVDGCLAGTGLITDG